MISLNGAHRNVEKIRRYIIPPTVEIEVGWDDEAEAETITILWDNRPQKTILKDLWENL